MGTRNLSHNLLGSGSTDLVQFNGGVDPGVKSDAAFGQIPTTFTVESMGSTVYSYQAATCSVLGNQATALNVSHAFSVVVAELIRKGILKGTVSS